MSERGSGEQFRSSNGSEGTEWTEFTRDVEFAINDLLKRNSGQYSECLAINPDGHIAIDHRWEQPGAPFLPVLFTESNNARGTTQLRGPTTEHFFKILKDLEARFPHLTFTVEEEPENRRWVKYVVTKS